MALAAALPAGFPADPARPAGFPADPARPAGFPADPDISADPSAARPRPGHRPALGDHLAVRAEAGVLAADRLLPVTSALTGVLPSGGLRRGSTVLVSAAASASGATSLALELLAGVSIGGHWCAAAGLPELGVMAAAERGIDLSRYLLVPDLGPHGRWQHVVAALLDAVDAVLLAPPAGVRPADARQLAARGRDRGTLLVVLERREIWPVPGDLRCQVSWSRWTGLSAGHGLLTGRDSEIEVSGRGAAARPRRASLRLPA